MSEAKVEIEEYSDSRFWNKVTKYAKAIGSELLEKVLQLYYALESENCDAKHKAVILASLGYLISPIDAIPDLTPILGYTDDAGLIGSALIAVANCIDEEVRAKAAEKLKEWFN